MRHTICRISKPAALLSSAEIGSCCWAGPAPPPLQLAGSGRAEALDEDTYAQPERFFSFRRATHLGEANYGRQISLIGLG